MGIRESWPHSMGFRRLGRIQRSGETMPLSLEPGQFMMSVQLRKNCSGKLGFVFFPLLTLYSNPSTPSFFDKCPHISKLFSMYAPHFIKFWAEFSIFLYGYYLTLIVVGRGESSLTSVCCHPQLLLRSLPVCSLDSSIQLSLGVGKSPLYLLVGTVNFAILFW